jgi:thioredoxin 1
MMRSLASPRDAASTRILMKKLFLAWLGVAWLVLAAAAPPPYDESADAKAAVQQALSAAKARQVPVLVVLGANWCEDCRALSAAMQRGKSAELIAKEFEVVKVDVGNFNRNLDLAASYGNPIAKGIPAAVILSPAGKVVYATRAGELADARRMSDSGVYDFFFKRANQGTAVNR